MIHNQITFLFVSSSLVALYKPSLTDAFTLPQRKAVVRNLTNKHHPSSEDNAIQQRHNIRSFLKAKKGTSSSGSGDAVKEEEEWFPSDPSETTAQLLEALWGMVVMGCDMKKGEHETILFPSMEKTLTPKYLERIMNHLDMCKDICDDFGVNTVLTPHTTKKMGRQTIAGFTVRSFKNENAIGTLASDGDFKFAPDPLWDDDEAWDNVEANIKAETGYYDEEDALEKEEEEDMPVVEVRVPDSDEEMEEVTKNWVRRMMSDMGVCPFTTGSEMAGLPIGKIYYTTDRCSSMEEMYRSYWKEVVRVETLNEKDLSTTLLIAPNFCHDNIELFESFSNTLTKPLESLGLEDLLQLVFFHPEWTFRDGGERSGSGAAANYARRSPWPMINILRTSQVRAAQRGIPTGLVYQQNERTLNSIGTQKLESMLRLRDWEYVENIKVDRRDMEALRVAQDFQKTGVVKEEDQSFEFDSTPAVNKVDKKQIEGGDMVKVVIEALEKRLMGGEDGDVVQLSGTETSAAMMASDFLIDHLKVLLKNPDLEAIEKKKAIAKQFYEENTSSDTETMERETDVLFGSGGIKMEDDYDSGINPAHFY